AAPSEAGQMAASDYVPIFFKNRLHLVGRPQMSTSSSPAAAANRRGADHSTKFYGVFATIAATLSLCFDSVAHPVQIQTQGIASSSNAERDRSS
ncbi:hypothetical protein, partial [Bradyrhizobium sp. 151]|uniref:hypothetical protein n=1 Tax=Bradyrhizobium sp. 151 TaxID=2782626 RepID=UPI001FFC1475